MKLLAPNGKPSNLTPEQYALVRTPEFKAWFGDWENSPETASKVIDENGEPLVCYHITDKDFNIFKPSRWGKMGIGIYFTPEEKSIQMFNKKFGNRIIKAFLKSKKLLVISNTKKLDKLNKDELDTIYDGIRAKNVNSIEEIKVLKPNQIKLADGTNTTFDSNNPDIRYAEGGHLELDIKNVLKYLNPTSEEKEISIRQQWDDLINRFSSLIPYFFEQENIDYNCEDYECIDFLYENNLDSNFEKWIIDNFDNFNFEDFDIPSWYYFEKPKLIKGTFIHYSNNVDEILKNGFTKGVNDISILGMTTHLGDEYKKGSGFIFAYHIDDVKNIKLNRYGENCVLFEGIGVRAYHKIDKEYEVIINPKDIVNIRPCIRYKNGGLTMKKPKAKLLAPNGKPSNLTPEQYKLVRTPAFKKWFGDWENDAENSSKVVDENGEPLVVYHGTRSDDFYEFENKLFGYRGFYFTDKKSVARNYGSNIRQFFLNSKNFVSEDMKGGNYSDNEWIDDLVENSEMDNKDVHLLNFIDPLDPSSMERFPISNIYIIFNKSNIKLADGTNTTFDSNNPDIRYKNGGIVTEKTEILYHGTSLNRANKILKDGFDLERQSDKTKQGHKKAISFTSSYQEAKEHSDWAAEKFNDKPAIISITIPFEILNGKSFFDMNMDIEKAYKLFELKKIDGVSFCDYETGDGCEEMEVAIFNIEKLNKNKLNFSIEYSSGGEINSEILSSQEVENKLGRKLHWWNDNVVTINGANYKKVFLRPEYRII